MLALTIRSRSLVLGTLASVAITGWSIGSRAEDAAAERERGEAVYVTHQCEGCHEVAYVPGQTVYRLDGLSKRHTVESIAAYLGKPTPPMPDFELTLEDRRALARYLLATFP